MDYRPPAPGACNPAPSAVSGCCIPPAIAQSRSGPPATSRRSPRSGGGKGFRYLSVEEKFEAITNHILETTDRRALFIIDELDRVRDTKGLASVIKKMSSPDVKFLLVGVAHNVSTLLHDHASLERILVQVPVHVMGVDDSALIVKKGEALLRHGGLTLGFSVEAVSSIVKASGGFPWFVHTFALESARLAYDDARREVTEFHVNRTVASLGNKQFAQQFYDMYHMAVRDSTQREIVLRLFAKWRGLDIPTSDIYPLANQLQITNPSVLAKQLTTQQCGRVLIRPPYAPSAAFRFTNAMFKHYINLSRPVYRDVDKQVDELWKTTRA